VSLTVPLIENGRLVEHETLDSMNGPCGHVHYTHRAPWLRAAVLGANDGLVTVGALMTGIGAADVNQHQLLLSAVAALVSGVPINRPSIRVHHSRALGSTLLAYDGGL
jgi:VIT1/CCC1 family predicted Fe2+/Mn2+ transporter